MAKNFIELTLDEIRTGQMITERAKTLHAAAEAATVLEKDYMNLLREKYELGPEYLVLDWTRGMEALAGEEEAENDQDN